MAERNPVQLSIKSTVVADLHQAFLVYLYRCDRSDERIQRAVKKTTWLSFSKSQIAPFDSLETERFQHLVSFKSLWRRGLLLFCQDAEVPKANEDALGSAKSCRDQDWSEAGD